MCANFTIVDLLRFLMHVLHVYVVRECVMPGVHLEKYPGGGGGAKAC